MGSVKSRKSFTELSFHVTSSEGWTIPEFLGTVQWRAIGSYGPLSVNMVIYEWFKRALTHNVGSRVNRQL